MSLKYLFILFGFSTLSFTVLAQKAERGFKNLEKNDLVKAKESFAKVIAEDSTNCAAHFGMSVVLSNENSAERDYFKAWDHFLVAKKNLKLLTEDDNVFLKEFFTLRDTERRNKTIQYNLEVEEKIIEDKLIKFVREENNLAVAEKFIAVYPNSKFYENVVHIRNHLEFRKAEKTNTFEAYNEFLKKYPNAAQVNEAINARNLLAFQHASKINTVEAFNDFIKNFPKAYHFYDAMKKRDQLAFDLAKKQNTIEALDVYISRYPESMHIPAAKIIQRKLLYEKAKLVNSLELYNDFISRYPEGEFFVDIFNLKTHILGQDLLKEAQGNKEMIQWIKGFDSGEKNDSSGGITLTADKKIVFSGTRQRLTGEGTEAWVNCVDLEGKSLWNKSFGSMPQNKVNFQLSTLKGDILIGGWNSSSNDSVFRKAWLFEISSNGNGKWERNFDGKELMSVFTSPTGEVYTSGYTSNDTVPQILSLSKLNSEYQKLWSREYIKSGVLNSFAVTTAQNLIMGAGAWLWRTDNLGYIQWEKVLPATDSIIAVNTGTVGSYFISGSRNNSPYLAKINDLGVFSWEKNFPDMSGLHFDFAASMPDRTIFTRFQGDEILGFMSLSEKGDILKEIRFTKAQSNIVGSLVINSTGEIYTVFTKNNFSNSEIVVCKILTK